MPGNAATCCRRSGSTPASSRASSSKPATWRPNPVPSKAMMRTLGHDVGECRSPMGPTPDGLEAAARQVYDRLIAAGRSLHVADGRTRPRRHRRQHNGTEVTPLPSRVVFLGGLGEIGRNCMAIEQGAVDDPGRSIVLIDCGLMFPDANMHGIDLILPDFTYLRENAQPHRRRWCSRTATRTTSAPSSTCCATTTASATCATIRCRSTGRR